MAHRSDDITCPRCLVRFRRSEVRFRDKEGRIVDEIETPQPGVGEWVRAVVTGDPANLNPTDPQAAMAAARRGYVPICPADHELGWDLIEYPSITFAFVGRTASGKSLYLASLINALVDEAVLNHVMTVRMDARSRAGYQPWAQDFIDHQLVVPGTSPNFEQLAREPIVLTVALLDGPTVNLIFFDADGSQFDDPLTIAEANPQVFLADVICFFIPSSTLNVPLHQWDRADQVNQGRGSAISLVTSVTDLLRRHRQERVQVAGLIITKADDIDVSALGVCASLLEPRDYRATTAAEIDAFARSESAIVERFVASANGVGILTALSHFPTVHCHLMSTVRGEPAFTLINGEQRRYFPQGRTAGRFVDPILVGMAEFVDLGGTR